MGFLVIADSSLQKIGFLGNRTRLRNFMDRTMKLLKLLPGCNRLNKIQFFPKRNMHAIIMLKPSCDGLAGTGT